MKYFHSAFVYLCFGKYVVPLISLRDLVIQGKDSKRCCVAFPLRDVRVFIFRIRVSGTSKGQPEDSRSPGEPRSRSHKIAKSQLLERVETPGSRHSTQNWILERFGVRFVTCPAARRVWLQPKSPRAATRRRSDFGFRQTSAARGGAVKGTQDGMSRPSCTTKSCITGLPWWQAVLSLFLGCT